MTTADEFLGNFAHERCGKLEWLEVDLHSGVFPLCDLDIPAPT
jgi:hypothetical protein